MEEEIKNLARIEAEKLFIDPEKGDEGEQGIPGVDGKDGKDGIDGKNGKDGKSVKGRDGTDGEDGQDGTDGKDGEKGERGENGKDAIVPEDLLTELTEKIKKLEARPIAQPLGSFGLANPSLIAQRNNTLLPYTKATADYVMNHKEYMIECDGTFSVTLPTAGAGRGKSFKIKNTGTGTITIKGSGDETIDGTNTKMIDIQYTSLTLLSNGSNYLIV